MLKEESKGSDRLPSWAEQLTRGDSLRSIILPQLEAAALHYISLYPEQVQGQLQTGARGGAGAQVESGLDSKQRSEQPIISPQGQLKVVLLVSWDPSRPGAGPAGAGGRPFDVYVHLSPLNAPREPPVKVLIRESHRSNAVAKDSQWVREAERLESEWPKDVEEVILMDKGSLLEGVSSNFYVVQEGALVTADQGILEGTVRNRIVTLCQKYEIPLKLQAPAAREWGQWKGAFITSTSRLVLPVDQLTFGDKPAEAEMQGVPLPPELRVAFSPTHDPLVSRIKRLVEEDFLKASEPFMEKPTAQARM